MQITSLSREQSEQEKAAGAGDATPRITVDHDVSYSAFKYEQHEWDNVPPVIPRFSFHLEGNVRGLSQLCAELAGRETTKDLRGDLEPTRR